MKRTLLIVTVLCIGIIFAATAFAQEKPAAAPDKPVKIERPFKAKKGGGEVLRVDVAENILVVQGKKGEEIFDIKNVKWRVYKNAEEVKAGDFVVIAFIDMDGRKVAKRIIKSKKPGEKRTVLKENESKPLPDASTAPTKK